MIILVYLTHNHIDSCWCIMLIQVMFTNNRGFLLLLLQYTGFWILCPLLNCQDSEVLFFFYWAYNCGAKNKKQITGWPALFHGEYNKANLAEIGPPSHMSSLWWRSLEDVIVVNVSACHSGGEWNFICSTHCIEKLLLKKTKNSRATFVYRN